MTQRYLYPERDDLLWFLLSAEKEFAIDTETNGLRPYHGDRIWGISLYFPVADTSFYIPIRYLQGGNIDQATYKKLLDAIGTARNLVFFNAKFDLHMLYQDGFKGRNCIEDVMIAAHLLNENEEISNGKVQGAYQLKRLARKYLGAGAVAGEEELIANAKKLGVDPKSEMWKMPAEMVAFYAMKDTEITWQLREFYRPGLERWNQWELYQHKNNVLLKVIMRMEQNGMRVDPDLIRKHIADITPRVEEAQAEFDKKLKARGLKFTPDKEERRVNLNSPVQVLAMFQAFGIEISNTDQYTMRDLEASGIELAAKLVYFRQQSKAGSTYYEPYLLFMDKDGIIHHSLNLTGTVTRRLSSSYPNFQNIPRKSGKLRVKEVFIPRPGYALVQWDYKALELRLGVHFCNEQTMKEMINSGEDMHQYTADQLNISRDNGKRLNFGLTYGMGWAKAVRIYGMTPKDAKHSVEGWHKLYPGFRKAIHQWEQKARQWRGVDGKPGGQFQYVRLMNGVIRHYNEYAPIADRQGEYRGAWNFVVQGTGAIVAETSALRACEALPDNDIFKPVNAVHDSFMAEVRLDKINEVVPLVTAVMEDWPQFNPKMQVDVEITTSNWYHMHKYNPKVIDRYNQMRAL